MHTLCNNCNLEKTDFLARLALTARILFDLLARLISAKNRWILPKSIKESVDLPDFVKESVTQIQILYTFQAGFEKARS